MTFRELGLVPPLLTALDKAGYSTPTPIQKAAIPPALTGRDVLGCAQTGTGKTAAFVLPILQRLDAVAGDEPALRALVLTPTRELAAQIGESFSAYGADLDLWHTVIFGGVPDKPQIRALREGVDTLVATPGRLLDLLQRGAVNLSRVELFVLDEADQMLDMGFLPDVRRIVAALPKRRQTLFFSATMPLEIRKLAEGLLTNPVDVAVARVAEPIERIDQRLYFVDKGHKRKLLVDLLRGGGVDRTLVFSRTKHGANRISEHLEDAGIKSAAIHGNKSQAARTRALEGFRRGDLRVLVATDLAARGIDIDEVTHVINFDLPNVPETYVHRIGRTARAGADGIAWSFCDHDDRPLLSDIERLIRKTIPRHADHAELPQRTTPAPAAAPAGARRGQGGRPTPGGHARSASGRGGSGAPRGAAGAVRSGAGEPGRRGPGGGGGGRAGASRPSGRRAG